MTCPRRDYIMTNRIVQRSPQVASTIKDVAKSTGLSIATISKYLNGGNLLEPNRIAIEAAIRKLGYRVNEAARGLKTNMTMTIGVIAPSFNSLYFMMIVSWIEKTLTSYGYASIILDSRLDKANEMANAGFLVNKKVDGIIALPLSSNGAAFRFIAKEGVPLILMDKPVRGLSCDLVKVENRKGMYEAVSALIGLGHKAIGLVSMPKDTYTAIERMKGFRQAHEEAGLPVDDRLIEYEDVSMMGGRLAMSRLLDSKSKMTAVIVNNDELSFGALQVIRERGFSIPGDISFLGFDIYGIAEAFNPALSVVDQPIDALGKHAAELIVKRVTSGNKAEYETISLEMSLCLRGSVRKL